MRSLVIRGENTELSMLLTQVQSLSLGGRAGLASSPAIQWFGGRLAAVGQGKDTPPAEVRETIL